MKIELHHLLFFNFTINIFFIIFFYKMLPTALICFVAYVKKFALFRNSVIIILMVSTMMANIFTFFFSPPILTAN